MSDFQDEVLKSITSKDITSVDIDYIKDKKSYRVGFGRLTDNFFRNNISGEQFTITDFECNFKKLLEKILETDKQEVVVGFKNMMHDLYTIFTGKRPEFNFHIGEFYYDGEDDKFLEVLREISLINKIMFQLRLNKKETYTTRKAIRIGKYYMKNFSTVISMKTSKVKGEELYKKQYTIFKKLEDAYKKYRTKPTLYLIPDKSSSTPLQTKFILLNTSEELEQHRRIFSDYEYNNILRNALFNLIIFLVRTSDENASKEWNAIISKLRKASGLTSKGEVDPDLFNVYKSYSIFINDEKMKISLVSQYLYKLYTLALSENHTQAEVVKEIINAVDIGTSIRFYEFYFNLKETNGKEIKVNFTELESIFNKSLSKMGEYFGLYKMKYSQTTQYLYNDVALHLILTYTKTLLEEVFKIIAPESYKKLIESGDNANINNLFKIMVSKYFIPSDIQTLLKMNPYTIKHIVEGVSNAGITSKTYRFNLYFSRVKSRKMLLQHSSLLSMNTQEFIKYIKPMVGLIIIDENTEIYAPMKVSIKLINANFSFKEQTITSDEQVEEVFKQIKEISNEINKKLSAEYSATPYLMIKSQPVYKNNVIIKPPEFITVKTLKQLIALGVKVTITKVVLIIEDKVNKNLIERQSLVQQRKLDIIIESLNIISSIPLPYTHLIKNIIKEEFQNIDVFRLITFLIKNKFLTKGNARYLRPEFKLYSYLILSHLSALIFNTLINTIGFISKNNFSKTFIISGRASSISISGELIINTSMVDRESIRLLNGLITYYNLNRTEVKIYYYETPERIQLFIFSVPIVDLIDNKTIQEDKLIEKINYNIIMSYTIDKTKNFNITVRTSNRIK